VYSTFLHDVVYLYAVIVDEMIKHGLDYRNGTDVMHRAKNFQFDGIDKADAMLRLSSAL